MTTSSSPRLLSRTGTILILVAGISALLASLALAFLARMRSDAEESAVVVRETQAHIMLMAGCNWIMESSRLGYGAVGAPAECFGWIDVRDGKKGPKPEGAALGSDDDSRFPVGTAKRCPMYVEIRPPFAVMPKVAPNPIDMSATAGSNLGKPYVRFRDPVAVVDAQSNWTDYITGKIEPDPSALCSSWFRVYRDSAAGFIVTCGAGGTLGYRNWGDVTAASAQATFNNDPNFFNELRLSEAILWYRVEWSAAVASSDYQNIQNEYHPGTDFYMQRPFNTTHESRSQGRGVNAVGTISYVQRLIDEPANW